YKVVSSLDSLEKEPGLETPAEIRKLLERRFNISYVESIEAKDVVTVHVNDAPHGMTLETYRDNDRRLPMETGVIDLPGFMTKLATLDYDGPVTAEPFSERVNAIGDPVEAARLTAEYMDRMWKAAGLE
ncbi:MAG: DUF4845 domain-containing protein, partial [Anaerolineae bacterium]